MKTIQEIVNEILKVGHGVSNKKLKNATRENKEFFLSFKTIEGIWSKAIQPRRIEQTQCFECLKKSGKSPNFLIKNADKNQNMGIEKNKVSEEFTTLNKSDFFASSMMKLGGTPEISFSKNDRKKEFLGHEIHKNFIPKQKSFKSSVKSLSIDPVYKSGVQENNKYIFCKHKVAKGDDILAIFSKWLFESGSSNQLGLEELNLLSIQILAKIFRKGRGPFKEEYLLKFYCLLLENIKKDDSSGFLKICVKLFEVNLPNTYCIMKEFILQFADRTFKSQPTIFLDVYSKFISRFVCSYLGRLKYIGEFEKKFDKYVYSLDYWINHVIECLKIWDKKEKNNCLHVVNWVFTIHNVNNRRFNSIVKKIFNSCKEKENNKQNKLIALKMMGLCFNIILSVGEIYHLKKLKADDGLNKEDVTDIKNSLVVFFEELEIFLKNFQIKVLDILFMSFINI